MPTQKDFADHVGITQPQVSDLMRRGVLSKGGSLADWRLAYARHLREQAAGRATSEEGLDLAKERALLARSQRAKLDLEIAEMERRLIPAEEVEQNQIDVFAAIRAKLLAIPSRCAPQVVGLTVTEAHEVLRALVNEALLELSAEVAGDELDEADQQEVIPVPAPTPRPDGDAVGRRKPKAKPRGQRRARPVSE